MGNLAALKAKLQEASYNRDGDMAVGAVIAPEVIVHLTAAGVHFDWYRIIHCAEFESSSVWRSGVQDEAIY